MCLGEAMGEEMQEAMSAEEIEEFDNKMTQVFKSFKSIDSKRPAAVRLR